MKFSSDQEKALDLMGHGESVFLTGGAGSGKSEVIREFARRNPNRVTVHLGTTGNAAQMIGGQTLHSFFGLGGKIHTPHDLRVDDRVKKRIRMAKCFILDEISMARIDHFQGIRDRLFGAARGFGDFAGYQLIVVGDFAQLPPVIPRHELQALDALYGAGNHFAFQSRYWSGLKEVELTSIHRQADDLEFAAWLNEMRKGQVPDLSLINSRVGPPEAGATRLVATNDAATRINIEAMNRLPGGRYRIEGEVKDTFDPRMMRVPPKMMLKPGTRVVICANDMKAGYTNGSAGTLVRCERDSKTRPVAVVKLDSGEEVTVTQHKWENVRYEASVDGTMERRVVGTYRQLPLLPGWAITIHRSQGMSLDSLHVDTRGSFAPGQAYVALSRATRLSGLTLAAPVEERHILFDERVRSFMERRNAVPMMT
ncbi:ATP-dependent DNA helicase [Leisingera caerulea]|uniref:ATP-dependent DNA helicase n=1 Tax=Leisingera caerulea TaxID=506591 RepID=UPI00041FC2E1|nr:AAA family ATPase [Leisingera caerulea]